MVFVGGRTQLRQAGLGLGQCAQRAKIRKRAENQARSRGGRRQKYNYRELREEQSKEGPLLRKYSGIILTCMLEFSWHQEHRQRIVWTRE